MNGPCRQTVDSYAPFRPPTHGDAYVSVSSSFAPVKFLHPVRVKHWRKVNVSLLALWAALAFVAIVEDLSPSLYVTVPLSLIAVYFFVAGLLRSPA